MITEEMLCAAAARSCEIYVSYLERGYNPENQHEFSLQFKKKIKKLKRKADHPVFYHAARQHSINCACNPHCRRCVDYC